MNVLFKYARIYGTVKFHESELFSFQRSNWNKISFVTFLTFICYVLLEINIRFHVVRKRWSQRSHKVNGIG